MRVLIFSVCVWLIAATHLSATNYYVSTIGNDLNAGTDSNAPLKTIEKGLTLAVSGDFIYVAPGTYTYANGGTLKITLNGINLIRDKVEWVVSDLYWTFRPCPF